MLLDIFWSHTSFHFIRCDGGHAQNLSEKYVFNSRLCSNLTMKTQEKFTEVQLILNITYVHSCGMLRWLEPLIIPIFSTPFSGIFFIRSPAALARVTGLMLLRDYFRVAWWVRCLGLCGLWPSLVTNQRLCYTEYV